MQPFCKGACVDNVSVVRQIVLAARMVCRLCCMKYRWQASTSGTILHVLVTSRLYATWCMQAGMACRFCVS